MNKGLFKLAVAIFFTIAVQAALAENFLDVYKDALQNDPTFQQALANRDLAQVQVPLSVANLLPNLSGTGTASNQRYTQTGSTPNTLGPIVRSLGNTVKASGFTLTLNQSIFNFQYWMNLASAKNTVKAAYATYSFAIQDLIQRTAQAYFNVLNAEDNLTYTKAEKLAFYNQYIQAKESYEVGVKTITDVYNAKASYDNSIASYVAAQNQVADSKEALAAITGRYYKSLLPLVTLPLITPMPNNIDSWTHTAITHNWQISAAHYTMLADQASIHAAEAQRLPNLAFQGQYTNNFQRTIYQANPSDARTKQLQGTLNVTMPIYTGGQITAQVQQAIAQYDLSAGQFQSTYRGTIENTRQAFLGVISGVSKVQADQQAVISQQSSLEGTEEGYRVGTRTMIDVLNVQTNLYNALKQNATDRYAYVMSLIDLKENAGTLDIADVAKVNSWLGHVSFMQIKKAQARAKYISVVPGPIQPTKLDDNVAKPTGTTQPQLFPTINPPSVPTH